MKFVIGRALTILSWDDPVTAFFEKVEKLCHSLGRPSRSDFVHFQFDGATNSNLMSETLLFGQRNELLKKVKSIPS